MQLKSIPRRARKCLKCEKAFEQGQEIMGLLLDEEKREDYCLNCFETKEAFCTWKSQIPTKEEEVTYSESAREKGLRLLNEYLVDEAPAAYALALYLHRRGILHRIRPHLYEDRLTGDLFHTPKVERIADIDALMEKIVQMISIESA